jgi:hypothetical protein
MDYTVKSSTKKITLGLALLGILAVVYGVVTHIPGQRIWANVLVNSYFFLGISVIGTLWMAIQYVAEAGWSSGLKRIPEAMAQFIPVPGVLLLLVIIGGHPSLHWHHLYHWMDPAVTDPASDHFDSIIAGKSSYLNFPFFFGRALIYVLGWFAFTYFFRQASLKEDAQAGLTYYKKSLTIGALFLVFYGVTSSTSAWDWMMSIDTHWFSTLFGWYNFATLWVSGIAMMAMITVSLKRNGYMQHISNEHLHDLGKFMFAFSIFWTYLWFSQFMLIWYSNIPEEVTYFMDRWENYRVVWFALPVLNFVLPILILMDREAKRSFNMITVAGVIIVFGHWMDVFQMVMPGALKDEWGFGPLELGMFLGFLGAFLYVTHSALSKASLVAKNHPFLDEAAHHHV